MDTQQSQFPRKYFIIEQVDQGLYDWALCEYFNMLRYLQKTNAKLVFTNTSYFEDNASDENEDYKKNYQQLQEEHEKRGGNMIIELKEKIGKYIQNQEKLEFDDQKKNEKISIPFKKVILLDMRGEKELQPSDLEDYDAFVFGGILGDHPPKDRTKELRNEGFELRKLTKIQMSTDTAVLASKIIMYDKVKLEDIPFVEEPEIEKKDQKGKITESCQMEGFTYVSAQYDPENSVFVNDPSLRNEPLMHPKIKNELLFVDFDFS
ncbi:hypothetical protein ABPG72_003172 [Tetrahymena utriculariae]